MNLSDIKNGIEQVKTIATLLGYKTRIESDWIRDLYYFYNGEDYYLLNISHFSKDKIVQISIKLNNEILYVNNENPSIKCLDVLIERL